MTRQVSASPAAISAGGGGGELVCPPAGKVPPPRGASPVGAWVRASSGSFRRCGGGPTSGSYSRIRARGVEFGAATERIETVLPSPREAALLESTTAMPMLLLNRRSVDTEGVPIEAVRALYRGDRVAFEATLTDG